MVLFDDGGMQGLALLDRIANRRALLVLDAVALGAEPGTSTFCADGVTPAAALPPRMKAT